MSLLAAQYAQGRRPDESVGFDVPPRLREHRMAGRGQTRRVRALPTGDEPDACGLGQAEEVECPRRGDLLDGGGRRRQRMERGILIPRRDKPVRGQCGGQSTADHETEVTRARGGHQAGFGSGRQRVDDDV